MTIKISVEQHVALADIESKMHKGAAVHIQVGRNWWGEKECLNDLSVDDFIKCLYMQDYEVDPEFKNFVAGDYVFSKTWGKAGKVVTTNDTVITTVSFKDHVRNMRHATKSEIEQAKERRFWARLNRKPNQYEVGDICFDPDGGIGIVTGYESKSAYNNFIVELNEWMSFESDELTLISPVDQRLDVTHDD